MTNPENQTHTNMDTDPTENSFIYAFNVLSERVHDTAVDKGWWEDRDTMISIGYAHSERAGKFAELMNASNLVALEHSELSEGLEGMRKSLMDDKIPEFTMEEAEAADVVIRLMDRAKARKLRVAEAIIAKMKMNQGRSQRHGGKLF